MNGILGYLKLDGSPPQRGTLEAMVQGMASWGVDGSALWQDDPMGLGCLYSWCTPESAGETLPFEDVERGLLFTAGAFLDNREELLEELGLSPDESRNCTDTLLVHRLPALGRGVRPSPDRGLALCPVGQPSVKAFPGPGPSREHRSLLYAGSRFLCLRVEREGASCAAGGPREAEPPEDGPGADQLARRRHPHRL